MARIVSLYGNRWVRYLVTAVFVAIVIFAAHPGRLLSAAASVNPAYLVLALVLTVPFLLCKIARWYLMLRAARIDATPREAAVSLVGGMGLALVTPARLGEVVRVAYLRDPQKMRIGGLVMLDKGFDVLVLAALSIAGAWKLLGAAWGVALTAVVLAGLVFVFASRWFSEPVAGRLHRLPGGEKMVRALGALESLQPAATIAYLGLTLLSFVIVLVQFGILLLNWHGWDLSLSVLTFPLVVLANVLPITVAGLGVREGLAALLLAHYGVSTSHAVLAAFLMFAINTGLPGVIGAFLLPAAPDRRRPRALESR